jgi:hypothetical protein
MPDSPKPRIPVSHADLVTALLVHLKTKVPDSLLRRLVKQPDPNKRAIDPVGQINGAKRELIEILVSEGIDRPRWEVTMPEGEPVDDRSTPAVPSGVSAPPRS